jgi:hypothetical protein
MLMTAIFSDAVGREIVPTMYPMPATEAASRYVRVFLQVIDVRQETTSGERRTTLPRAPRSASSR